MWSLGCILAELYTGYVLFQNDSVQGLLARVIGIIGPIPEYMMKEGKLVSNFFTREGLIYMEAPDEDEESQSGIHPAQRKKKVRPFEAHFGRPGPPWNLPLHQLEYKTNWPVVSLMQVDAARRAMWLKTNVSHHLSHTESVRLRLLGTICFDSFWKNGGQWVL